MLVTLDTIKAHASSARDERVPLRLKIWCGEGDLNPWHTLITLKLLILHCARSAKSAKSVDLGTSVVHGARSVHQEQSVRSYSDVVFVAHKSHHFRKSTSADSTLPSFRPLHGGHRYAALEGKFFLTIPQFASCASKRCRVRQKTLWPAAPSLDRNGPWRSRWKRWWQDRHLGFHIHTGGWCGGSSLCFDYGRLINARWVKETGFVCTAESLALRTRL